jgi:hypothetical protein
MRNFNKHIIVMGSARSGTSWLCESLAQAFRYRLLFEPDHPIQVPEATVFADKKLDKNKDYLKINKFLKRVFSNRIDSDWIGQNSNRKFKMHLWPIIPKKYIIKFIRANLALSYLNENFGIPIIFLTRNPYDVIASQNRVKFPWLYDLSLFQEQKELVDLVFEKTGIHINKDTFCDIELLAVRWCIENVIPLKHQNLDLKRTKIIKYEDLKGDFSFFKAICDDFSIELAPNMEALYTRPSSKTHPKSNIRRGGAADHLISEIEHNKIKRILNRFELDFYKT